MTTNAGQTITGNVRVEERKKGRVWVAGYFDADGEKRRKTLGPAWVRDAGRRTARGAIAWRAAPGSKPDATYLTPGEAADALERLLGVERHRRGASRSGSTRGKTFGDACERWLAEVELVNDVAATTRRNYRVIVGKLIEQFPASTPLRRMDAPRLTRYQNELLADEKQKLARRTIRTRLRVLVAILESGRNAGWYGADLSEFHLIKTPAADPDFNVLEPAELARVVACMLVVPPDDVPRDRWGNIDGFHLAVMVERRTVWAWAVRLAAFTGIRFGELRTMRWRDVDVPSRVVHVRRNLPSSAPKGTDVKAPKSERGRSLPLIDQALAVLQEVERAGYPCAPNDLVLSTRAGGHLNSGNVRDAFYGGLVAAGMGHLREKKNPMVFHDLRHTFGTLAVRKLPLTDVQAYMGHADVATTMRYVHHVPRIDAARVLSEAFA